MKNILEQIGSSTNKDGTESKSYKINDLAFDCLYAFEKYINEHPLPPISMRERIKNSMDILGYADVVTNKEEDRRRLLITDVTGLSGNNGNIWAYRIGTKSLGSGKTARLTVKTEIYNKKPISQNDIIYATELWKNQTGYWYLLSYNIEE